MVLGEKALKGRVHNPFQNSCYQKPGVCRTHESFSWTVGYSLAFFVALRSDAGMIGRQYGISLELSPAAFAFDTFDEALYAARPASR